MFKKGFSTVACMDLDYNSIIKACKAHNISGVEVRLDNGGNVFGITDKTDLKHMKSEFDRNGLVITDLGSSACFAFFDETAIDTAKRAIDTANEIGCMAVRVFLGYFAAKVNPDKPEPDYDGIVKALVTVCDYAKEKNTEVWVETHNEFALGKVLRPLLAEVDRGNLKIIWDIIHTIEDGESIEETWSEIGEKIAHIHIKDGVNRHDPKWHDFKYTCLGEGELPLYDLLDMLKRVNYDGYLSFEWEIAWREELKKLPRDLDYVFSQYNKFFENYGNDNGENRRA